MPRRSSMCPLLLGTLALIATLTVARAASAQVHPSIDHVTPTSGPPGTLVTITGQGFVRGVAVYLHAVMLPIVRRTRTRLVVRVPEGAESGMLLVTNGDEEESAGEFRVTERVAAPAGPAPRR